MKTFDNSRWGALNAKRRRHAGNPGFRVGPAELSDDDALTAIAASAYAVVHSCLDSRLDLLRMGFSDDHSICRRLDGTAREYAALVESAAEYLRTALEGSDEAQ